MVLVLMFLSSKSTRDNTLRGTPHFLAKPPDNTPLGLAQKSLSIKNVSNMKPIDESNLCWDQEPVMVSAALGSGPVGFNILTQLQVTPTRLRQPRCPDTLYEEQQPPTKHFLACQPLSAHASRPDPVGRSMTHFSAVSQLGNFINRCDVQLSSLPNDMSIPSNRGTRNWTTIWKDTNSARDM